MAFKLEARILARSVAAKVLAGEMASQDGHNEFTEYAAWQTLK